MKSIKMLGLAALAALMAMAFVGATSAMAESTQLCTADENPCAAGNVLSEINEVSEGKGKLLSSSLNVECNVTFEGEALGTNSLGAPLIIDGSFSYTNCNNSCVVTEENGPAEIKVLKTGTELSEVVGEGLVHVNCAGFIVCTYNGVGLKGHGLGALLAANGFGAVTLSEQVTNKESGSLCPSTAKLDLTTKPAASGHTYIRS